MQNRSKFNNENMQCMYVSNVYNISTVPIYGHHILIGLKLNPHPIFDAVVVIIVIVCLLYLSVDNIFHFNLTHTTPTHYGGIQ